jgi:hypothetical protein
MAEEILEPKKEMMEAGVGFALETILGDPTNEGKKLLRITLNFPDLQGECSSPRLSCQVGYARMQFKQSCIPEEVRGKRDYFFKHDSETGWYRR